MKPKGFMPPTMLAASIAAMVGLHGLLPGVRVIPAPWRWAGVFPIVFGVVWNLWADRLFKTHRTTVKPHLQPTTLVSNGPYAMSRHPMYVGMVAMTAGTAIALCTFAPMVVPVIFAIVLAVKFVPMEEASMQKAFGESWQAYKKRVRRWV
jgi:protein-S-isoprenylcysteine O-methyltransferase Ste14